MFNYIKNMTVQSLFVCLFTSHDVMVSDMKMEAFTAFECISISSFVDLFSCILPDDRTLYYCFPVC